MGDLHLYLTVPFVLSWSVLNAMSCGAVVLASDTPPVREVVRNGETGLLAGFDDVEKWCRLANEALDQPAEFRGMRAAAREVVRERFDSEACLPRLLGSLRNSLKPVRRERVSRKGRRRPRGTPARARAVS